MYKTPRVIDSWLAKPPTPRYLSIGLNTIAAIAFLAIAATLVLS